LSCQHVKQLLHTLNLNLPALFQKPQLNLDINQNSPDFSLASVSLALLMPTDLLPAQAQLDPNNPDQSPYDSADSLSLMPSSSLLFNQQATPAKMGDPLEATHGNLPYGIPHLLLLGIQSF
jgi:hypothetical protein